MIELFFAIYDEVGLFRKRSQHGPNKVVKLRMYRYINAKVMHIFEIFGPLLGKVIEIILQT